jgi:hypothetical protein
MWALRRFTTLEDYMAVLKPITLLLLQCSTPAAKNNVAKGQLGHRLVQPLHPDTLNSQGVYG